MSLVNCAVVHAGRVAKCVEVRHGWATVVWIDHRDRIVTREVPASALVKFSEAVRPRSLWPDVNMAPDDIKNEERAARRNRRRTA